MKAVVQIRPSAAKALEKAPVQVQTRFRSWFNSVQLTGLESVRRIAGYHDEPLKGQRKGQRSIRLNNQWRAIYEVEQDGQVIITVMEVTPHDYRRK